MIFLSYTALLKIVWRIKMRRIIDKCLNYLYYLKDVFTENALLVKLDGISFNAESHQVNVSYRLGRQRLLHKSPIREFEAIYHRRLSVYDRQRFTKFLTHQQVIDQFNIESNFSYSQFIKFLQDEIKNDKLL